jgi:FAD/FMN-containing dehydrogenase
VFADRHEWYVLLAMVSPDAEAGMRTALESVLTRALDDGLIADAVLGQNEAQTKSMWRLREAIVEAQGFAGGSIKHDVSVRVSDVPRFVAEATERVTDRLPGIRVCAFGHVGDGNIHFNLSQPEGMDRQAFLDRWEEFNEVVHDIVHRLGGSFSAEHGIGLLKRNEMNRYKSDVEIQLMRTIKRSIDPRGIMNPGKVLPRDRSALSD